MDVLLVTDLEGVAGVDDVGDLLEGTPGFPAARKLLEREVEAACLGLREGAARADKVLVSDSHRGGPSPTLDPRNLPPGALFFRGADAYDPSLLDRVDAVACLGMHAGDRGFTPHTIDLSCLWETEGRPVSETDLLLGLAAERGLPVVFVAGDDALAPGVPFVPTKTALSAIRARSRDPAAVATEIRRAAAGKPVPAPGLTGTLAVRFRSRWMAEVAERAGGLRLDETAVRLPEGSLSQRIAHGRRLVHAVSDPMFAAFRPWALPEEASTLAARSFERRDPTPRQSEARRALTAFLSGSEGPDDWCRANRALTLHMLEGHAPAFFAAEDLAPVLGEAVERLALVPRDFPPALDPVQAMARLDAIYVLHERGHPAPVDGDQLARFASTTRSSNVPFAWLLGEIAHQIGLPGRLALPPRPYRRGMRIIDLFWVTHQILLETRYLRKPLPARGWETATEELLLATPFVVENGHLDLAAQLCFCLTTAGEGRAPERERLLASLASHQNSRGEVIEDSTARLRSADVRRRLETHCTAAALLAFATAC